MAWSELPQFDGIDAPERMRRFRSGSGVLMMRGRRAGSDDKAEAIAFFDLKCAEGGLRRPRSIELAMAQNQRALKQEHGASSVDNSRSVGTQIQPGGPGEFDGGVFSGGSRAEIHLELETLLIAAKNDVRTRIQSAISDSGERRDSGRALEIGWIDAGGRICVDESDAQQAGMGLDDDDAAALQLSGRRCLLLQNNVGFIVR